MEKTVIPGIPVRGRGATDDDGDRFDSILVRALRSRLASSILTLAAATLAFAIAAIAPLYLHAAGDSVVRSAITAAPRYNSGVVLSGTDGAHVSMSQAKRAEKRLTRVVGQQWFGSPVLVAMTGVGVTGPSSATIYPSSLLNQTAICAHLVIVAGACDLRASSVIVSRRTADELGASLGTVLKAKVPGAAGPLRLTVTGIYHVHDVQAPYWWGLGPNYFDFGAYEPNGPSPVDSMFASQATALRVPARADSAVSEELPLRATRVNLSNEAGLLRGLASAKRQVATSYGVYESSRTPAILASAQHERHLMSTIVVSVAVELLVLALWVLASLMKRSVEAREMEIRLVRLRGFPWRSVVNVVAAEPGALCVSALPMGLAFAWVMVKVSSLVVFAPRTAIAIGGWLWISLGLATAGVVGVLGFSVLQAFRATDIHGASGEARRGRTGPESRARAAQWSDLIILVLMAGVLVQLGSSGAFAGGRTDALAAAAPGVIALGVAVVGVQSVLLLARLASTLTVRSSHVGVFLAARQLARRPVLLRQARVLVVALCLACFASAAWSIARTNRAEVARFSVGTSRVANVDPPVGTPLQSLVREVDPNGRWAMAAAVVDTHNANVLAVDPTRLTAVAGWYRGVATQSLSRIATTLSPPTQPEVRLNGRSTRLTVHTSVSGATVARGAKGALLEAELYNSATGSLTSVDLGRLRQGATNYTAPLGVDCLSTCRFDGVSVVPTAAEAARLNRVGSTPKIPFGDLATRRQLEGGTHRNAGSTAITVLGIEAVGSGRRPVTIRADLHDRGWSAKAAGVRVTSGKAGPVVRVSTTALSNYEGASSAQSKPMAGPSTSPTVLPAVVTKTVLSSNGSGAPGTNILSPGLDANTVSVAPSVVASSLPEVGSDATMVSLSLLQSVETSATSADTRFQVWLSDASPSDAIRRLNRAGLRVTSVTRAAVRQRDSDASGPGLADDFLIISTAAALLIAAVSTLAALAATVAERSSEATVLEVAGVRRRTLAVSLLGETAALATTTLFGLLAGVVVTILLVPSLPELANRSSSTPALRYPVPLSLLLAVTTAVVAAILLVGAATTFAALRRSTLRLRETGLR